MATDNAAPAQAPRRRTGGRSARVRAAVLQATVEALLADGVDALSVADIAERAGVHETSIYRRWGTRANLALEAVLSRVELEIPVPDTGSLRQDLLVLLREIAVFAGTPLGETLVRIALRHDLPEYEQARELFWTARLTLGSTVLERAAARGELRQGVDPSIALETLMGPLYLRLLLSGEPVDDDFLQEVVDLLLLGIAAVPAAAHPTTPP
jgi:AcrR family transcriptional regulator